jgi:hypothetical protein
VVSAFIMNRPDEERQLAPEWIQRKREITPDLLGDSKRPLREAA